MGRVWRIARICLLMAMVLVSVASATELAPSVQLRPIKDEAKVGEACIFEASIVNPISPDGKNMTAQIVLKVPPNVIVFGESFTKSGSGQYVAVFKNIPPGDAVYQRVYVKGLKPGEYIISADLIWYYEGEQTPHINSLDYNVKFIPGPTPTPTKSTTGTNENQNSENNQQDKRNDNGQGGFQLPEIPWQYIVIIAIIAIVIVVAVVVRILK